MAKIAIIIASLIACFPYDSLAVYNLPPRTVTSCGYVGGQIYCYGGDTSLHEAMQPVVDENIHSLDINAFNGEKSYTLSNKWNTIVPSVDFDTENRREPSSIVLSDGKRFLIQGGYNKNDNNYINQTIIYDTSSNTWTKGTRFTNEKGAVQQIYRSTAINLPNDSVGFYGGTDQIFLSSDNTTDVVNLDIYTGFRLFTTLSLDSGIWSPFSPQTNTPTEFLPHSQTATFNPSTGKIYYLGGTYLVPGGKWNETRVPFHWISVFDTNSGDWLNETLHGDVPTHRLLHTANLLPNSQDIIIYGGSNDSIKPLDDYCYTLNLESNIWTMNKDVNVPLNLSGPRFSHSAVLVESTLFILFGRGNTGELGFPVLTIDVSNTSSIVYTDTYVSTTNLKEHGGLSKGAIGGIAAGSTVFVLGIIAFIFLYLRRQKKSKRQDSDGHVDIDWDKIEDRYKEVSNTKSIFPQFTEPTEISGNANKHYDSPNSVERNDDLSLPKSSSPDTVVANVVKPSVRSIDDHITVKPDVQ